LFEPLNIVGCEPASEAVLVVPSAMDDHAGSSSRLAFPFVRDLLFCAKHLFAAAVFAHGRDVGADRCQRFADGLSQETNFHNVWAASPIATGDCGYL